MWPTRTTSHRTAAHFVCKLRLWLLRGPGPLPQRKSWERLLSGPSESALHRRVQARTKLSGVAIELALPRWAAAWGGLSHTGKSPGRVNQALQALHFTHVIEWWGEPVGCCST